MASALFLPILSQNITKAPVLIFHIFLEAGFVMGVGLTIVSLKYYNLAILEEFIRVTSH